MIYFILLLFGFLSVRTEYSQITAVMRQNLLAYPYQEADLPLLDARFKDFLEAVVQSQENLQENSKRRVAFSILDGFLKKHSWPCSIVQTDDITFKDLTLFGGQTEHDPLHYVAHIVDRTQTIFGRVYLYGMLALPSDDASEFSRKQKLIQELIQNKDFFETLRKELLKFKRVENSLITFWLNDLYRNVLVSRYFDYQSKSLTNYCNKNSYMLYLRSIFGHQQRALTAVATVMAAGLLPVYGVNAWCEQDFLPERLHHVSQDLYSSGGPIFGLIKSCTSNTYVFGTLAMLSGLISALYVKESIEWASDNFLLDKLVYQKMKQVAIAVQSLKNIEFLLQKNETVRSLLHHHIFFKDIFCDKQCSKELQNFLERLSFDHFTSKSSLFCDIGNTLVVFKECLAIRKELEDVLMALGEIDAFCSIATLYQEHQHSQNPYCFATCKQAVTPMLELEDFWNPCVKAKVVVTNSVSLGSHDPVNMIITGPNAGGKSTLLKGLAGAVLITQALGITPARQATLTMFSTIMTYLNIVDDLASGNSLFKSQVLRMQKIYGMTGSLQQNQKALILLDEMFNGTSPKEAESCAYLLGQNQQVMNVVATHYQGLVQLPQAITSYKNYHVSVNKQPDGSLKYPFKLEEGISDQHIALDILLNEGFNNAIVSKAREILESNMFESYD